MTTLADGIGYATSKLFVREGAKVVVSDIVEKSAAETAGEIKTGGGVAIFVKADTGNPDECKNLVDQAVQQLGGLHIAVNNAGIAGPIKPLGEYPIEGWEKVISVNLSGVFYCMRYQIPAMLASGGGSIVNISSILGKVASKGSAAYVSAKHGVVGLTEAAALEYAGQKIRVNSIGPGYILTPMLTNNLDEATMKSVAGLHPMGRLGTAEEVAELALWLNSDKASFVTGSYYSIDGGYLIQ